MSTTKTAPALHQAQLLFALGDTLPGLAELLLDNTNHDPYALLLALDVVGLANTDRGMDPDDGDGDADWPEPRPPT
jgi:hypothetical protein